MLELGLREPGDRRGPLHRCSHSQEPRAQPLDQAGRQHPRPGGRPQSHHAAGVGSTRDLDQDLVRKLDRDSSQDRSVGLCTNSFRCPIVIDRPGRREQRPGWLVIDGAAILIGATRADRPCAGRPPSKGILSEVIRSAWRRATAIEAPSSVEVAFMHANQGCPNGLRGCHHRPGRQDDCRNLANRRGAAVLESIGPAIITANRITVDDRVEGRPRLVG